MKFRRKPLIVEAEQFLTGLPLPKGVCMEPHLDGDWIHPHVHTIHGGEAVLLKDGDWVLPEPDGIHFYPCKPGIFEATYDPA